MKKINKKFVLYSLYLIIYLLIISLFRYNNILNYKIINIIDIVFISIIMFLLSFKYSRKKEKNGAFNGIKLGIFGVIILILLGLIFKCYITKSSFIYYLILFLSSIFGGIVGVNKKKT